MYGNIFRSKAACLGTGYVGTRHADGQQQDFCGGHAKMCGHELKLIISCEMSMHPPHQAALAVTALWDLVGVKRRRDVCRPATRPLRRSGARTGAAAS